jgi:hypothetical protein
VHYCIDYCFVIIVYEPLHNIITVASGPTLTICLWISIIKHSGMCIDILLQLLLLYEQAWCWLCDQKGWQSNPSIWHQFAFPKIYVIHGSSIGNFHTLNSVCSMKFPLWTPRGRNTQSRKKEWIVLLVSHLSPIMAALCVSA